MNRNPMVRYPAFADVGRAVPDENAPVLVTAESVPGAPATGGQLGEMTPGVGITFLMLWAATGILTAFVVRRRGHDFRPAAALGLVFGPLYIPLAMRQVREGHDEEGVGPIVVAPGRRGQGPVDVLVGLAGPAGSAPAVIPVLRSLDRRLGRLTLARVLNREATRDQEQQRRGALELACASLFLHDYEPATVLVPGDPATALLDHASEAGYDLVFIIGEPGQTLPTPAPGAEGRERDVPMLVVVDTPTPKR